MCGRFVMHTPFSTIAERYFDHHMAIGDTNADYNVTPGQQIAAIRSGTGDDDGSGLKFDRVYWGFRPKGAGERAPVSINARAETVASSRYFAHAFHHRRCLIPSDGWYEWRKTPDGKQPVFITLAGDNCNSVLFFAGIWTFTGEGINTCCAIITEPAAPNLRDIHHRQPVVLDNISLHAWIDPAIQDRDAIRHHTQRRSPDDFTWFPVSTAVNKPANNDSCLIAPLNPTEKRY